MERGLIVPGLLIVPAAVFGLSTKSCTNGTPKTARTAPLEIGPHHCNTKIWTGAWLIVIFVYCSLPFLAHILHNAYLLLHAASWREVNTRSVPSQPQVKPSRPQVRPSEFQVNQSQSKVKPTQPDINPSRPQVKQSQPQVKACACIYSHTYVCLLEP